MKINTPYDPKIQVPTAYDKVEKAAQLDSLIKSCIVLYDEYLAADSASAAKKDKQLRGGNLVLFEKIKSYLVYRYTRSGREWVVEFSK